MTETTAPPPRVPARLVLASIAGLWLCYLVVATLRSYLVGLEFQGPLFWRRLAVTIASMAVTAGIWPLLRLLDARSLWAKAITVAIVAFPASLALAAINQWVFSDIENQVVAKIGEREGIRIRRDEAGNVLVDVPGLKREADSAPSDEAPIALPTPEPHVRTIAQQEADADAAVTIDPATAEETRWRQLTDVALSRYFLIIAWAAIYLALLIAEQARVAERREGEYRRAAKQAELRSLRYQINPHFLFNTLNSLSSLVMTGKQEAAETMIQSLASFYRRGLSEDPTGDHPLSEEIELQRLYLEIEAVRFPERLKLSVDVSPELGLVPVPGMILQPLVENAVKYGVARSTRPVTIAIAARSEFGQLVISVADDGPAPASEEHGMGIGLANVRDRLNARFGDAAGFVSGPVPGGYRTELRLPLPG
ncbi:sensor histidine kinase [Novosphingobium sp. TH158]|uniref:sensor histidine kinase n=1 Tax=Novosphingobium sp. TH158 TaxID=2067455 RepID=UPI000C7E53A4|nr:histidine kinase [Novosphingobium sp. TH158]PLK27234.1 sensor histidine kinase [Novosphingobium sp. TH158]